MRLSQGSDIGSGLKVVHNYGHGGSGVTLSWGCAGQVQFLFIFIIIIRDRVVIVIIRERVVIIHYTEVLNGGSGGGYPKSGPKLNFNGSGAS